MLAVLFADGLNIQFILATAVIGAGIGGTVATGPWFRHQVKKRTEQAKAAGQPARTGDLVLKWVLLLAVGLAVIGGGIAWQTYARQADKAAAGNPAGR
jgi:hypothetical protein